MKKILFIVILTILSFSMHAQKRASIHYHEVGKTYPINELVSLDGKIYKALVQTNTTPPSVDWKEATGSAAPSTSTLQETTTEGNTTNRGIVMTTGEGTELSLLSETNANINLIMDNFGMRINDGTIGKSFNFITGSGIPNQITSNGTASTNSGGLTSLRFPDNVSSQNLFLPTGKSGTIALTSDISVNKTGTPTNNQLAIWTGDGTVEGDSEISFDTSLNKLTLGNPDNSQFGWLEIKSGFGGASVIDMYAGPSSTKVNTFFRFGMSITGNSNFALSANGSGSKIWEVDDATLSMFAPNTTVADIDAVGDKAYLTKEYADINYSGGGSGGALTKVSNFTSLRDITVQPANGSLYYVEGHTIAGYGGGLFHWDSTSTATDDNGVTVKATTITTGRFIRNVEDATVSIEDFGGISDTNDVTTDDSVPFRNAVEYLEALSGGKLIIPVRGNTRFFVTNSENFAIWNMTNITITGGGKIYIGSSNVNTGVTQGRGTLVKVANGTDNFKVIDIDILVSAGTLANNFTNGVFCQEELGSWSRLTFEKVKLHSEARPDTQTGNHGITFHRNTLDISDNAKAFDLTIRDCDIYLTGQSIYGINTLRDIENVTIDNTRIELTASDNAAAESYNPIGLYGDSKNFSITNCTIYSGGHSAIAASMSENGVIAFNRVYGVKIQGEAGIEVEYKQGHGSYLIDPDFQPKSVKVHNNYVEGCYWGIAVLTRETFNTGASTYLSPYDVIISNNTVMHSTSDGIVVASNVSGTPDYTTRIKNVSVLYNYVSSEVSNTNIRFYDSDGGNIIGNTMIGGGRNLMLGRSSVIFPIGNFTIKDNEMSGAKVMASFQIESLGKAYIEFAGNKMDGLGAGIRGVQSINSIANGTIYNVHGNFLTGFTDGIRMDGEAVDTEFSMWYNNIVRDCTGRGMDVAANNGIASDNITINCVTADTYTGTGMTASGNKDN